MSLPVPASSLTPLLVTPSRSPTRLGTSSLWTGVLRATRVPGRVSGATVVFALVGSPYKGPTGPGPVSEELGARATPPDARARRRHVAGYCLETNLSQGLRSRPLSTSNVCTSGTFRTLVDTDGPSTPSVAPTTSSLRGPGRCTRVCTQRTRGLTSVHEPSPKPLSLLFPHLVTPTELRTGPGVYVTREPVLFRV